MQKCAVEYICKGLEDRSFEATQFERCCFDIAARKGDVSVLVKVLNNVDSFSSVQADDLKKMASLLGASAVVCGYQGRNFCVSEGYVYERFEIPVVHPDTFLQSLDLAMPLILSKKGKNMVNIDVSKLHNLRQESDVSFRKMSDAVGVSKKTLYLAEKTGRTSDYVASVIERFLGEEISVPVDIFSFDMSFKCSGKSSFEAAVTDILSGFGYSDFVFQTAPVNLLLKEEGISFMCDVNSDVVKERKVENLKALSDFFDLSRVMIVKESSLRNVCGIAVLRVEDIKKICSKEEFVELVAGRE